MISEGESLSGEGDREEERSENDLAEESSESELQGESKTASLGSSIIMSLFGGRIFYYLVSMMMRVERMNILGTKQS